MRYAHVFMVTLLLSTALASFAGDVQVLCEPDLRVFLDDQLVGSSSAKEDGLFLVDVARGSHTIRVEKDGSYPQSFKIEVLDVPVEVKVSEFVAIPLVTDPDTKTTPTPSPAKVVKQAGSVVITSAPQNCVVDIDGKVETKDTPQLEIGSLAAGEHTITYFKAGYGRISKEFTLEPGTKLKLRGNLQDGTVEVVHIGKGSLQLITSPDNCEVRFLDKLMDKHWPVMNISRIPAGEHPIKISWGGRDLTETVLIKNGQRTIVKVSFIKDAVPFQVSYKPE